MQRYGSMDVGSQLPLDLPCPAECLVKFGSQLLRPCGIACLASASAAMARTPRFGPASVPRSASARACEICRILLICAVRFAAGVPSRAYPKRRTTHRGILVGCSLLNFGHQNILDVMPIGNKLQC